MFIFLYLYLIIYLLSNLFRFKTLNIWYYIKKLKKEFFSYFIKSLMDLLYCLNFSLISLHYFLLYYLVCFSFSMFVSFIFSLSFLFFFAFFLIDGLVFIDFILKFVTSQSYLLLFYSKYYFLFFIHFPICYSSHH